MRTITIHITVPDDVEIRVEGQQSEAKAFTPKPAPPEPDFACPEHGTGWRLIKAGVNKKTGKPYNPFWVCQTEGCDVKPWQVERGSSLEQMPF